MSKVKGRLMKRIQHLNKYFVGSIITYLLIDSCFPFVLRTSKPFHDPVYYYILQNDYMRFPCKYLLTACLGQYRNIITPSQSFYNGSMYGYTTTTYHIFIILNAVCYVQTQNNTGADVMLVAKLTHLLTNIQCNFQLLLVYTNIQLLFFTFIMSTYP